MTSLQRVDKIDMFTHINPPKYEEALDKKAKRTYYQSYIDSIVKEQNIPTLWDLTARFKIMDRYEGVRQVLTIGSPPLEMVVDAADATELAKIANDEMAELIAKYPDRFVAAAACLPMNNVDAALRETERAIEELHFKGILVYSPANDKPLDSAEFMALYEKMWKYDLPIWIHPARDRVPDYAGERPSKYVLSMVIGWPYETTLAMCRLVFSGVFEKYPGVKFITHHLGGMLPFYVGRITSTRKEWLSRPTVEYFQMFYGDTVIHGNIPSLMCGHAFFGADHIVFATDAPYAGVELIDKTISAVELMDIPDSDKKKIFEGNAKRLLQLPG